jgi:hypothetical protein
MHWALAIVLLSVFLWVGTLNLVGVIQSFRRKRTGSLIPLLGGCAGALGLFIAPSLELQSFWYLPLLLDAGSGLLVAKVVLFCVYPKSGKWF